MVDGSLGGEIFPRDHYGDDDSGSAYFGLYRRLRHTRRNGSLASDYRLHCFDGLIWCCRMLQ